MRYGQRCLTSQDAQRLQKDPDKAAKEMARLQKFLFKNQVCL